MAEPMSQCLAWGQFFWFFLVFPGKTKKNKMVEPMSQCLAWGQYFCFFGFFGLQGFLQYSAFPKKTLVSFPKKIFFWW